MYCDVRSNLIQGAMVPYAFRTIARLMKCYVIYLFVFSSVGRREVRWDESILYHVFDHRSVCKHVHIFKLFMYFYINSLKIWTYITICLILKYLVNRTLILQTFALNRCDTGIWFIAIFKKSTYTNLFTKMPTFLNSPETVNRLFFRAKGN